jgi:hypothetical protein
MNSTEHPTAQPVTDPARYLHISSRRHALLDLEQHLEETSALSRALWLIVSAEDFSMRTLASAVADHASAAEFVHSFPPDSRGRQ